MKLKEMGILTSAIAIAVLGAFTTRHALSSKSKFSTAYYSKPSGPSWIWTKIVPAGYHCLSTTQHVYCTIFFIPSPTYTKVIDGQLPPTANYTTPYSSYCIYKPR